MIVVVAMSGGVDSSVTAALLKENGYEVIGATMQIWPRGKQSPADSFSGCCGMDAVTDAKKVAHKLGISHYVMDFRDVFAEKVIVDFYREYSLGRTPNPCIRCNQYIKFGTLLDKAGALNAGFIATGHYARIERDRATLRYLLRKGVDPAKDQSYFLYALTQQQLSQTLLPLGVFNKDRIREMAGDLGLPVASKAESQEICFIPDGDYADFLKAYIPQAAEPGPIVDEQGKILGSHRGILSYTIGQRKGLGVATGEPYYVIALEPAANTVVVGSREATYGDELVASRLNWIAMDRLEQGITAKAKIRYHHREAEATITPLESDEVYIKFKEPQMAITPGQAVVFYDGDIVIGGGIIERSRR